MARYGAYGPKMNYGRAVVGVIRSTFLIDPAGRIVRAWYGVKATGHAERVMKEVAAAVGEGE
jgi:peroxiredoxin Q/BCP